MEEHLRKCMGCLDADVSPLTLPCFCCSMGGLGTIGGMPPLGLPGKMPPGGESVSTGEFSEYGTALSPPFTEI